MSPILTRPVREQLEHDRVIRLLQARYKRKHEVVANAGAEQNQSVTVGELAVYPDLLLFTERGRKLEGTVEVETGESVNQLEALAEWGVFGRLPVPLHLYVPSSAFDTARRLCTELQIPVAEIWTYLIQYDQARFTMMYRSPDAAVPKARPAGTAVKAAAARKPKAAGKPKVVVGAKGKGKSGAKPAAKRPKAVSKSKAGKKTKASKAGKRR